MFELIILVANYTNLLGLYVVYVSQNSHKWRFLRQIDELVLYYISVSICVGYSVIFEAEKNKMQVTGL